VTAGQVDARQLDDLPTLFWSLAKWAIGQGLITEKQARAIVRPGTRKEGYWVRHLLDLCAVLSGSCSEHSIPSARGYEPEG